MDVPDEKSDGYYKFGSFTGISVSMNGTSIMEVDSGPRYPPEPVPLFSILPFLKQ
jgi:hypothetical protein